MSINRNFPPNQMPPFKNYTSDKYLKASQENRLTSIIRRAEIGQLKNEKMLDLLESLVHIAHENEEMEFDEEPLLEEDLSYYLESMIQCPKFECNGIISYAHSNSNHVYTCSGTNCIRIYSGKYYEIEELLKLLREAYVRHDTYCDGNLFFSSRGNIMVMCSLCSLQDYLD